MAQDDLQDKCERGQTLLMQTRYIEAEGVLWAAARRALDTRAWDTLARVFLPLQEARRQIRQRAGEGTVDLHLIAASAHDPAIEASRIIDVIPHGQLLVAGWGSAAPAAQLRMLAAQAGLYVETFLAAAFPATDRACAVAILPTSDTPLPDAAPRPFMELRAILPPGTILLDEADLGALPPAGARGTAQTYAVVMNLWERLHRPFLRAATAVTDPLERIEGLLKTIVVDSACELAHQRLADAARQLDRGRL